MPAAEHLQLRRRSLFALSALVLGVVAGIATYQLQDPSRDGDTAVARAGLDDRAVGWPYHNTVIEQQQAILSEPDALEVIAARAAASGRVLELDSSVPVDQTAFDVVAVATEEALAVEAADLAVGYLIEASQAERTSPLLEEIEIHRGVAEAANAEIAELRAEVDAGVSDERLEQIKAQISEAFSREAVANSEIETLEAGLEITVPQIVAIGSARIDDSDDDRLVTALAAAFGVLIIALVLFSAFWPRPRPQARHRRARTAVTAPVDVGELQTP